MKKARFFFFLIFILLFFSACPKEDIGDEIVANLKIWNKSSKKVVYLHWYINKNYIGDSIFSPQVSPWDNVVNYTIVPDTFSTFGIKENIKNAIKNDVNLLIYFFDPDTLAQVPWERIARENIILKRIDIHSWKELEDRNFEIAYP